MKKAGFRKRDLRKKETALEIYNFLLSQTDVGEDVMMHQSEPEEKARTASYRDDLNNSSSQASMYMIGNRSSVHND